MATYTSLTKRPRIVMNDKTNFLNLNGEGGEIVCFIGKTPNTVADTDLKIKGYTTYSKVKEGIGSGVEATDNTNNLLKVVGEFFNETQPVNEGDLGVKTVYIIDLGKEPTTTTFTKALTLSEKIKDVTLLAFTDEFTADLEAQVISHITSLRSKGQPRIAYFPAKAGATDEELIKLTSEKTVQNDNVVIVENVHYGAVIGKIAVTPYYVEPGRDDFRSLNDGDFPVRSFDEASALQNAGILICESDPYRVREDGTPVQCIVTGVSTGFAAEEKTTACLLHALRNNNHQVREIMKILGTQLKENETVDALTKFRLAVNTYLESEVKSNHIQNNYSFNVYETDADPYNLVIDINIAGINATYLIVYNNSIVEPEAVVSSNNE